jgi:RNA polymerase sigma-70 factor, ECF subfamily
LPCITLRGMDLKLKDDDESLMQRYQSGDAGAFDELYSRHRGGLYRFIARQCRSRDEAEELFQEVWMNVIQSREVYRVEAKFRTWLFTLAHHRLMDFFRRHKRDNPRGDLIAFDDDAESANDVVASRVDEPQIRAESQQQGDAILRELEALPAPQREAFLLHEEGGMSIEEIAHSTGVTFEAAKSRLRYAIARLRERLKEVA